MTKSETSAPEAGPNIWQSASAAVATPMEVFYVVENTGNAGARDHHLHSALYESRLQAETELARLQSEESKGSFSVWKSETFIEPAEWLHRVVRIDGTLILPRLHGVEKLTSSPS